LKQFDISLRLGWHIGTGYAAIAGIKIHKAV
jgi:hypothetical protein